MSKSSWKEEARVIAQQVGAYFTKVAPRLVFQRDVGLGRHGGALLIQENDAEGKRVRRLVIKYSIGHTSPDKLRNADDDLRNEAKWLKMLKGAEHIVQFIDLPETSLESVATNIAKLDLKKKEQTDPSGNTESSTEEKGNEDLEPTPTGKVPTFALEFLEGGTLRKFINSCLDKATDVPVRLQWRIWLCMVRQCVAMAYPPQLPLDDNRSIRETIIDGQEICRLTQNSGHSDNFLFSLPQGPEDTEHHFGMPVLKLIDFGRGILDEPEEGLFDPNEIGSKINLWNAAGAFSALVNLWADSEETGALHDPVSYEYQDNGTTATVQTLASPALRTSEMTDRSLRDLLVRCMSAELYVYFFSPPRVIQHVRPAANKVLQITEERVRNRGADEDPDLAGVMEVEEDDESIARFIQRHIFDVDDAEA
ncbi:hypothetical protein F5Y18DRAFT_425758 [Xylariaceae sp. FL1019]|nr:hypothetical protein F5Y18DRAFT_425758 [Xylariaceae sp. FL1019]